MDKVMNGLTSAKWSEDKLRREVKERDYNFYNDDHNYILSEGHTVKCECIENGETKRYSMTANTFLEDIIFRRVSYQEAYILKEYIETDPLTSNIIKDKSILFKVAPEIKIPEASKEMQTNFDKLLETTKFYSLLREIQRLTELQFDFHIVTQVRDNKVVNDMILSQDAFVEQNIDDPTKFDKFYYQVGVRENSITTDPVDKYICWSDEGQFSCEVMMNGKVDKEEEIESFYPKGIIPITVFRNYLPINTYWSPRKSILVEKNIQIDLRLTALNMLEDFNLPQKVRTGMDESKEGKLGLTFTEDILRNDEGNAVGDVKYIRPDAPVKDEKELIEWRQRTALVANNLAADSLTGKTYNSGFELYLSKSQIIEKNKEDRPLYLYPIREMLQYMMLAANQTGMRFGDTIEKLPEITINFGELVYTQTPEEKERSRAMKVQAGIWSAVQSIMEDDPDLTEEQAIEKLKKIKEYNELTKPKSSFEMEEKTEGKD